MSTKDQMKTTPAERFEALFGEESENRGDLPMALRRAVYERMKYALCETDGRKLRRSRVFFLKTFHTDPPESVFTRAERKAVFHTIPHIFDGERLS